MSDENDRRNIVKVLRDLESRARTFGDSAPPESLLAALAGAKRKASPDEGGEVPNQSIKHARVTPDGPSASPSAEALEKQLAAAKSEIVALKAESHDLKRKMSKMKSKQACLQIEKFGLQMDLESAKESSAREAWYMDHVKRICGAATYESQLIQADNDRLRGEREVFRKQTEKLIKENRKLVYERERAG